MSQPQPFADPATAEAHIALVRRFVSDVLNRNDLTHLTEFVTEDFVRYDARRHESGAEDVRRYTQERHATYTDLEWRIDQITAHGPYVAAAMSGVARHRATGREVTGRGVALIEIRDGRIASSTTEWDRSAFVEEV